MTYFLVLLVCTLINELLGALIGFKLGYLLLFIIASSIAKALNKDKDAESDEIDFNAQWKDVQRSVPQAVIDHCGELSGDIVQLEKYLNTCANDRLIKRRHICAILREYASPYEFEKWFKQNNPEAAAAEPVQNNSSQNKVSLATTLKGQAPDAVLQHCDSISDKKVLLETYLMQCENQGKISHQTAVFLLEQYTQRIEASPAPQQNVQEKTKQDAHAAGLSVYNYVKTQLPESVRRTIEEKKDDIPALERYLRACLGQKLICEYYFEVILEEAKGHCALRRLQATGGQRWNPHYILRGMAPENILIQCDKDASSYVQQIIYLNQQVLQKNVTRQTADLILNIYKLAREQ